MRVAEDREGVRVAEDGEGVRVAEDTEEHSHITQEHEAIQFKAYQDLEILVSEPDMYDE